MKVLIADDDITSRQILESVISRWGFQPVAVEDGLKALQIMSEPEPPSLLLLDWEMPGLDGLSLAHHLSDEDSADGPYIIMLTARDGNHDIVSGLAAGASDYITKPFETDILKARLELARRNIELQDKLNAALKKLEVLASIDELTHLPNRRSALVSLGKEMDRSLRHRTELCIGLCDIDHFKAINDNFGHAAGDQILTQIANLLKSGFRQYDVVGRYGGEEFIFAMPTGKTGADMVLERLRASIATHTFKTADNDLAVTMSFGAVMLTDAEEMSLNDWIRAADEALYESKGRGRNQVTFYPFL